MHALNAIEHHAITSNAAIAIILATLPTYSTTKDISILPR